MTVPLTLRQTKGSKLTFAEMDNNFTALRDAISSGGVLDHPSLTQRDALNSHPMSAITGLVESIPFVTTDQFYQAADGADYRPAIQRAIDFVEASDIRQEIRISPPKSGNTHLLRTHYPLSNLPSLAAGEKHALVIRKPSRVKLVGNKNVLQVDTSVTAMQGIKSVLGIIPDADGDANELHIESIRFAGAPEGSPMNVRAEYIIKADYRRLRYSRFYDLHLTTCSQDVLLMSAFVIHMQHCRARFAGLSGTGFHLKQGSIDGGGGAMTGYHLDNCTVDYAGDCGIWIEGVSGHTYCKLTNCHVDFTGRDDSNVTVGATLDTSAAYKFEDVRGVVMEACGVEFCTRPLILRNARTFSCDTMYALGCGRTDNHALERFIQCTGFYEQVSLKRIENRNPLGVSNSLATYTVQTPNRINIPNSIINSQLLEVGGTITINNLSIAGATARPNTTATIVSVGSGFITIDNETLINASGTVTNGTLTSPTFKSLLYLETPSQFNVNTIDVDSTIPRSSIKFASGQRSSKPSIITTMEDFYESHTRRPRGGAIIDGKPLTGGEFNFWLNHSTRAAEHSVKFDTAGSGGTSRDLVQILDNNQDGYVTFKIEVMCMNTTTLGAVQRRLPATYIAYATCKNLGEGEEVTLFEKLGTLGDDYNLSLAWSTPSGEPNQRILTLSTTDNFGSLLVKMTALGRTTTQTQHFYWV